MFLLTAFLTFDSVPESHTFKNTTFQAQNPGRFMSCMRKEMTLLMHSLPAGIIVRGYEDRVVSFGPSLIAFCFCFCFFFLFLDVINDIVSWTFFLSIWSGVLLSALNLKICQEQNKQIVKKCRYLRPGIADPESENPKILE